MRDYKQHSDYSASRIAILMLVVALHVVAFYAFIKATNFSFIPSAITMLQTKFIPPDPPKPEDLPPPAPLVYPEATLIQPIPPEIHIETPPTPAPAKIMEQKIADKPSPPAVDERAAPITSPLRISGPHTSEMYPGKSVKNHESGRTALKICISTAGLVDSAEVTESSGFPRLDEAAIKIALDTRFKPAMRLGKPIDYCMVTGISFRLH